MTQQEFDNAFKMLPDAGSYPHDWYRVPLIKESGTLVFRKCEFILFDIDQFVRWELDKVEFI